MTREKTVFPDSEIPHLWANKIKERAKGRGSIFFEGNTIYSYGYHFPIAVHYKDIVLFTLGSYSNTTTKHIYAVRSAASHLPKIYCLLPEQASKGNHDKNLQYWISNIRTEIAKLGKARKPEIYAANIQGEIAELQKYMAFFKDAKLSKEQKTILKLAQSDDLKTVANELSAAETKIREAKEKRLRKSWEICLQAWRDNKELKDLPANVVKDYYEYRNTDDKTYLRVVPADRFTKDSEPVIETSKQVTIPANVAQRVYNQYMERVKNGGCVNGDCGDWKVLEYQVKQATEDRFVIGCHDIEASEIKRIANLMNW